MDSTLSVLVGVAIGYLLVAIIVVNIDNIITFQFKPKRRLHLWLINRHNERMLRRWHREAEARRSRAASKRCF